MNDTSSRSVGKAAAVPPSKWVGANIETDNDEGSNSSSPVFANQHDCAINRN